MAAPDLPPRAPGLRGLRPMIGRDPNEPHRAASPLELLFDLAFVVAFGQAANGLAHLVAEGHVVSGVLGFSFAMLAICWAWINFSWFASAFDTDDWFFRLTTMVQVIGVIIVALGLPAVFASIDDGGVLDNRVVVAGYVVMRVALIAQWVRAARDDPARRSSAKYFIGLLVLAQLGWILIAAAELPLGAALLAMVVVYALELTGPIIAERVGSATPWHAHHIAERYGLLAIIALGEVVFGTVEAVSALVTHEGWSSEAILVVIAGIGLVFGLWWVYFIVPAGPMLERYRDRAFTWGYLHILVYASIAAMGAGLHSLALVIEGESELGRFGAIAAVAIPVLVFSVSVFALYSYLVRVFDPFHLGLFAGTVAALVLALVLAGNGVSLGVCLMLVTASPTIVVVGYEWIGHRHSAERMAAMLAADAERTD